MTKIVLTFGLISGVIITILMWIMLTAMSSGKVEHGEIYGYSTMIIALSMVFFGIKSYRDNHGGKVTFLKGLQVGILISMISALCYAASWEVYYRTSGGDFMKQYAAQVVEKMKETGASEAEITKTQTDLTQLAEIYQNFFVRFGMTLLEILPVGILVTLISAALLRKREVLPAQPA